MTQTQEQIETTPLKRKASLPLAEFIVILSMMISLTALSIDAMLPALPDIGTDLIIKNINDRQLVVSILFLGLAVGQMFFGPLSDKTGRKPAIYVGYGIYIVGALLSAFAANFTIMLFGRLLQGIGISAPQAIAIALVRDRYEGREMARVMSFVMTFFVLVPMLAPTVGQTILALASWRAIFIFFIGLAIINLTWFALRMPETLAPEKRSIFSIGRIVGTTTEIVKIKTSLGYTISAGLIGGAFLGYLSSAQQIFQEQYALNELFPLFFAIISFSLGLAALSNTHLVMRFGMRFLINRSLWTMLVLTLGALVVAQLTNGNPPLWFLMLYLLTTFFCVGILFGNQNAVAMEPLGQLAGIGAAVVGSLTTLIQMPLGTVIGQNYNGTISPLIIGIAILTGLSILVVKWAES